MAAWRRRMGTAAAREVSQERAAPAEWANVGARNWGLFRVRVRGLRTAPAVALLQALAHNLRPAVAPRARTAAQG